LAKRAWDGAKRLGVIPEGNLFKAYYDAFVEDCRDGHDDH